MSGTNFTTNPGFDKDTVPSLDIAYEQAQRLTDLTLGHADALDAKAGIIVTAGGFVITGIAGLQIVAQSNLREPNIRGLVQALAYLALFTYLAVVIFSCRAFLVRQYGSAPDPRIVYRDMLTWHPARTKAKIT